MILSLEFPEKQGGQVFKNIETWYGEKQKLDTKFQVMQRYCNRTLLQDTDSSFRIGLINFISFIKKSKMTKGK